MPPGFTAESSSEAASICCDSHSSPTHHTNHQWMLSLLSEGVLVTQTDAAFLPCASYRATGLSLGKEKRKGKTHEDGRSFQRCWVMGGILVIQSHERPRAELLNILALEIPTLPTQGFPLQGCKRLLGGDASVHKCAAPLPSGTWLQAVSSWWCCGIARIGEIGRLDTTKLRFFTSIRLTWNAHLGQSNRKWCVVMLFFHLSLVYFS